MTRLLPLLCLVCLPLTNAAQEKIGTLYNRLGGAKGVAQIVDDLVDIVVKHPKIRPVHKKHFMEGDVAGLKKKLRDQIGEATGGPEKYKGKDMKAAHKGMGITNADFDALADCVRQALDKNKIAPADRDIILKVLGSMRKDVVEAREGKADPARKELAVIEAKAEEARSDLARLQLQLLTRAVEQYKLKHNRFPDTLDDLAVANDDGASPYVKLTSLIDPWGFRFLYDPSGPHHKGKGADIWTEVFSSTDRQRPIIGNWQVISKKKQ